MQEARIAACLEHDNIVEFYEAGVEGNTHFLAMEFVFGRDLGQIRDRCKELGISIPPEHTVTILGDVLGALHHAHHEARFEGRPLRAIHRDISPRNIVVGFDGSVKLLDFGLAQATAQLSQTRAGVLKGKYAYMSPEQVSLGRYDHRADIFGAGVVLWELLTGKRLFLRASSYETVRAVVACRVPFPRFARPDLPLRPAWVAYRALRRGPRWRYRTARRMRDALVRRTPREGAAARDALAGWMSQLFARELAQRDATLDRARRDPSRHRQIQDAGFELLAEVTDPDMRMPEPKTVTVPPPARSRKVRRTPVGFRWMGATAILIAAGLSGGVYLGSQAPRIEGPYGTIRVVADAPEVLVVVGQTEVGYTPVSNVVVRPGLHRIRARHEDRWQTVEVTVAAGEQRVVELTFDPVR